MTLAEKQSGFCAGESEKLFEAVTDEIFTQGYSIQFNAIPSLLGESLWQHLQQMQADLFAAAGVGRQTDYTLNEFVRRDEICWINGESDSGAAWLAWCREFQQYLNRRLFLGLFSFESHFAHYEPGAFYKKHVDAFKGESNRVLSLVLYLNPGWLPEDGGELVLYTEDESLQITPSFGTLVTFLSEDFPHEVLVANRDRYSIAGWFRLNTSTTDKVDPPV